MNEVTTSSAVASSVPQVADALAGVAGGGPGSLPPATEPPATEKRGENRPSVEFDEFFQWVRRHAEQYPTVEEREAWKDAATKTLLQAAQIFRRGM